VLADEPQRVSPGSASTVALDGAPYALPLAGARRIAGTMRDFANCTPDFTWDTRLWVEAQLRAADPQPIIAALDHGEIPACSVGNEPPLEHDAGLHRAAASAELIDAELVYSARQNNDYLFDVLGTDFTFALAVDALSTEPVE
jgi:hypothetical protein